MLAAVEPFVRANKKDVITNELDYWEGQTLSSGGAVLQNRPELAERLQRVEMGNLVVYITREDAQKNPQYLTGIQKVARGMEQFVMGHSIDKGRMHVLLVPDARFCPRGGAAAPDGAV